MVQTGSIVLGITAVLSALFRAFVKPKLEEAGSFRTVSNHNSEHCSAIEGLKACEDIWVDQPSGLAYLACGSRLQRAYWTPALSFLQAEKLPPRSADYIAILDLNTNKHRQIELVNLPPHLVQNGIHVHGLDLFVHNDDPLDDATAFQLELSSSPTPRGPGPRQATIYVVNHQPPKDVNSAPTLGAQSVIEVFDTVLGDSKATYRRTIEHELILTPNNLLGLSENSFYVTNDHAKKIDWKRMLEPFITESEINSIIFCKFQGDLECVVAVSGNHPHPNGIAKGPGDSIYMANSYASHLRVFGMQADHTLVLTDELKLPRMADNIFVTPQGSVFIAALPVLHKFKKTVSGYATNHNMSSPTEIWKVSNSTDPDAFYGGRLKVEKVLADDGERLSGTTGVAAWGGKLFVTGLTSPHVSVCEFDAKTAE